MPSQLSDFGRTAQNLARNPLGIIALFIVLVYGIAALVFGFAGTQLEAGLQAPLVWFLVLFPVLVLGAFGWLVASHHTKLYSPRDFEIERHFLLANRPALTQLRIAEPQQPPEHSKEDGGGLATGTVRGPEETPASPQRREDQRVGIYKEHRGLFIVHVLEPSDVPGQEFDVFIFLTRHGQEGFDDVERAEFFMGHKWGNEIFEGTEEDELVGIRTSAYGPFLCTCLVRFSNGDSTLLYRYIDFEMGKLLKEAMVG